MGSSWVLISTPPRIVYHMLPASAGDVLCIDCDHSPDTINSSQCRISNRKLRSINIELSTYRIIRITRVSPLNPSPPFQAGTERKVRCTSTRYQIPKLFRLRTQWIPLSVSDSIPISNRTRFRYRYTTLSDTPPTSINNSGCFVRLILKSPFFSGKFPHSQVSTWVTAVVCVQQTINHPTKIPKTCYYCCNILNVVLSFTEKVTATNSK